MAAGRLVNWLSTFTRPSSYLPEKQAAILKGDVVVLLVYLPTARAETHNTSTSFKGFQALWPNKHDQPVSQSLGQRSENLEVCNLRRPKRRRPRTRCPSLLTHSLTPWLPVGVNNNLFFGRACTSFSLALNQISSSISQNKQIFFLDLFFTLLFPRPRSQTMSQPKSINVNLLFFIQRFQRF